MQRIEHWSAWSLGLALLGACGADPTLQPPTAAQLAAAPLQTQQARLDEVKQTLEVIAASYAGMDALAQAHGAKVLHVLMQERREYHVDGYQPNEFIKIRLRGHEIARIVHTGDHPVLETFAILGQDPAVAAKAYLQDHAHLTAFGHDLLARAIAKRLAESDFAIGPHPSAAFAAAGPLVSPQGSR